MVNKKLIIISGSSKGIGKAIAKKFAAEGYTPVLNGRNSKDLEKVKLEIKNETDIESFFFVGDLSIPKLAKEFANYVAGLNLPIAALVNNAGIFKPSTLLDENEGDLEEMISVNLYSAYYLTKGLLPVMIKQKSGHIFNMCSVASIEAYPKSAAYSISKFALLGFSKALREELKEKNLKVTSLIPGATLTQSWDGVNLPESRFIKPADLANTVWAAYNLSDSSLIEEIIIRPQLGDI